MKTMLDILIENLPEGAEIKNAKEKRARFEFDFCYGGYTEHTDIFKTCAPGYEKKYVRSSIAACMAGAMLAQNDLKAAKEWLSSGKYRNQEDEPETPREFGNENIKSWTVVYRNKWTGEKVTAAVHAEDLERASRKARADAEAGGLKGWKIDSITPTNFGFPGEG